MQHFLKKMFLNQFALRVHQNLFKAHLNAYIFSKKMPNNHLSYLSQAEAIALDQSLFNESGFSVDQLMELAGLSVATAITKSYPIKNLKNKKILILCGPGNNGGDGLVAARHLKFFDYDPEVFYPKQGKSELFVNLVRQLNSSAIKILTDLNNLNHALILDAIFGFSFKPPVHSVFLEILNKILEETKNGSKLISVDIPSGWHVETGPPNDNSTPVLEPDCLISLTCPKLCAKKFNGNFHWVGGRFIPIQIQNKYNLNLPVYQGTEQCIQI